VHLTDAERCGALQTASLGTSASTSASLASAASASSLSSSGSGKRGERAESKAAGMLVRMRFECGWVTLSEGGVDDAAPLLLEWNIDKQTPTALLRDKQLQASFADAVRSQAKVAAVRRPLRPFWRPFRLSFTSVTSVLVKKS
jgi:hypothetical protein